MRQHCECCHARRAEVLRAFDESPDGAALLCAPCDHAMDLALVALAAGAECEPIKELVPHRGQRS